MFDDMSDMEILLAMELRFGPLHKTIPGEWNVDKAEAIDKELINLLQRYKNELGIKNPLPRVRSWVANNKVNFMFFDKDTGKRILLAQWLEDKESVNYEH